MWCDNLSAGCLASNVVLHNKTKHIENDIHFVREQITTKKLKVQYVPIQHQTTNIFTRSLFVTKFEESSRKLCVLS